MCIYEAHLLEGLIEGALVKGRDAALAALLYDQVADVQLAS